ncbi:hypothetical protein PHLGIDRAFT_84127, partial [Phlebiopsis gigantea 11061_1 CR5-6]
MSDLYRSAMHARISMLPPVPPPAHAPDGDEDEEAADSIGALPSSRGGSRARASNANFAPVSAAGYFEQALQVAVPESQLDVRVYYSASKAADATVIVCHHGAGWSGLTFACLAKELTRASKGECGVLAFDARGHGKTSSTAQPPPEQENLEIDNLVSDFVHLTSNVFKDPATCPTLLLVGHSLGGSVMVRACPLLQERKYKIAGVSVLDVVE